MSELCRKGCGRLLRNAYGRHGNYRDRGDGICSSCGRALAWHAGTSCFCSLSTGMPAPLPVTEQLGVPL